MGQRGHRRTKKTSKLLMAHLPFPSMDDIRVTDQGVVKLLLKLNPFKACGPDLLSARILKELAHDIEAYLTIIFQKSLDAGRVPKDTRSTNVTAIFKKGEKYQPSKSE